jgi:hypothetical protein
VSRRGRPIVHGAFSESQKAKDLRRIRRRMLSQNGIRFVRELTGQQRRYLDLFCQAYRIVERLEPLNPDGSANANMAAYLAACNTSSRALERLEASLADSKQQPGPCSARP